MLDSHRESNKAKAEYIKKLQMRLLETGTEQPTKEEKVINPKQENQKEKQAAQQPKTLEIRKPPAEEAVAAQPKTFLGMDILDILGLREIDSKVYEEMIKTVSQDIVGIAPYR